LRDIETEGEARRNKSCNTAVTARIEFESGGSGGKIREQGVM
jgi:hypothetical protein